MGSASKHNYYNDFYQAARVELGQRVNRRSETEQILDFVEGQEGNILEIGSNLGYLAKNIGKRTGARVIGIDTNSSDWVYKFAKSRTKNQPNVDFVCADGTKSPFADETFNCAVLSHVLEHFADPGEILTEIKRLLKAGGNIIIAVPKEKELSHPDHKQHFADAEDLTALLLEQGFSVVDVADLEKSIVVKVRAMPEQTKIDL